ncbi:MAG TPA: xanthine dehydrogenase family protein molybdopterin-binding subunit [Chloroflexota bacterium]|nr:xanthine dehydrogenase family protein molybdopterin-binding subunit [Chloroflexota bacterium]
MSSAIGHPVARRDGRAKVTGAACYSADVPLPGTLHGAILRSPLPYARIVRVDTRAARQAPGVHAVLTGRDLPPTLAGRSLSDVPPLCRDVVRYVGDRVAALAAESRDAAEAALRLIEVEYESLEPIFNPEAAIAPEAAVLHPEFLAYRGAPKEPFDLPNVCSREVLTHGDVEDGFRQSDLVLEHTYTTPGQHQGYLEPHSCLVDWPAEGPVHVWASNKAPFLLRDELARVLELSAEQVVVEPTYVGGDFGGKGSAMDIPVCAFLSRASGRPVRMVLSSLEEMTAANPRHAARIKVRSGLKRDGTLVARSVRVVFDGGAYAGYKPIPGVNLAGRFWSVGPYRIPHARFESLVVYTNNPPAGHMRAPGEAQLIFATEVDIDRLAEAVGLDPLRFRELNAVDADEPGPLGEPWRAVRLKACLASVRQRSGWDQPRPPGVGRGVALSHCGGGMGASSAVVEVGTDGRATLRTGVNDQGSGAHTVLCQIVAHELQLPLEQVDLVVGGTDSAPFDSGSSASRVTYVAGTAVQQAAAEVSRTLAGLAAELLGCPEDQVERRDGAFLDPSRPTARVSFAGLCARAISPRQSVRGEARFADYALADTPSFAALVAEVEVDPETGAVQVRRLTGAYDVGTVLNPTGSLGQIEGGLIQGLGFALMEEIRRAEGRVETVSLSDYKLPTALDLPEHACELIIDAAGVGPYGAKPIGELTNPLPPPAVANAVYDAVGARVCTVPLTAERIRAARGR